MVNTDVPKWIVLQLTEECNLRCKMCYEWGEKGTYFQKKSYSQLDINAVKTLVDDCGYGKTYYELFGGEPLMYPHIEEVITTIKSHNCNVDIATNGTLLEEHAHMLVKTQPNRIWVSLDGQEEINDKQRGKGVYKKVLEGINKLHELRTLSGTDFPKVGITTIVTPLNHLNIEKFFYELTAKCKIEHISIEFQLYATKEQYQEYEVIMRDKFNVIGDTLCAKGFVQSIDCFYNISPDEIERQLTNIRKYCTEHGVLFINNPKTIEKENIKYFFTAQWDKMTDKRSNCIFPWIHAEICATGDVSPCHTFHSTKFGNINNTSILEIWKSKEIRLFRKYMASNLLPMCTACSRYYTTLESH